MITFPFTDVINAIRNAKKGVEVRENLAQMGEYCKKFTEEAGTRADAAKAAAETAATNAKASEKKATDAVAGIEQTKADAVQAVQNAQSTATTAVQQAQSTATTAVTTKQTEAVQAVDDERDAALQQVADSTQAAQTAASNAAASEQAAQASKEAAATSAGAAESSATAASGSASAAATSESNAASSAQSADADADRAEAAANLAGTRANTDKTLKTENAPADAAAVGAALDEKANKDVILDDEGNVIFYSKAAVDKLLAGKLDLTGGVMTGELGFSGGQNGSILPGDEDAANVPGGPLNNLVIRSWWGVSFTTDCPNQTYTGKTAVGIDCRNGTIKAPRFEGVADNGVVASGNGYVRFGDGTQICWGHIVFGQLNANSPTYGKINFALPFANTDYAVVSLQTGDVGGTNFIAINLVDKTTTYADESLYNSKDYANNAGVIHDCIVIGRWK